MPRAEAALQDFGDPRRARAVPPMETHKATTNTTNKLQYLQYLQLLFASFLVGRRAKPAQRTSTPPAAEWAPVRSTTQHLRAWH